VLFAIPPATSSESKNCAERPAEAKLGAEPLDYTEDPMTETTSASKLVDKRIRELRDWRGKTLSQVREIIRDADPEIVEEWKWVKPTNPGTPVWSRDGGICTGETYKDAVKLTFFQGAALQDPSGLFNSSLDGRVRRAIDIREHDTIDKGALKKLVREAVALNRKSKKTSD
jgi:hypothetical protein